MSTRETAGSPTGGWRDPGALAELRTAHSAGRLEAGYGSVQALLARMPDTDLPRAGQLLARLDRDSVLHHHPHVPVVPALVTGQSTVAPLVAPLTAELARHGLLLAPEVAPYGSYLRDLLEPRAPGADARAPRLTLCLLDAHTVFEEVTVPWRAADVEAAARSRLALLTRAARTHQEGGGGPLVLNTVPLHRIHVQQLVDHRSRARLGAVWREFNAGLLALAQEHPGVYTVDLDPLIGEGIPAYEPRTALYAKARLSEPLLAAYAREAGHLTRHLHGRARKAVVLDLDGTLWGGVLGEDGTRGVEVGGGFRGEAFLDFQRVLKQLASQGVLLAVSSKNDARAVRDALRDHPDMLLREADFVRINANWSAKHDNLRDIADRVNLGLDSLVFVDDSTFECGLVRERLPQVAVVRVDEHEPALHPGALLADGWFDVPDLTDEDRERAGRYRTEARRQDFREDSGSYQDYLRGLGTEVGIRPPAKDELARVAQLTLRTNQFHLAVERMRVDDVRRWAERPGRRVLAVRARDRFGDHGLVGALFVARDGDEVRIDNYVLSCRVFARGIESACVGAVLEHARKAGARCVTGRYRPSPRNTAFAAFYPAHGFGPATGGGSGEGEGERGGGGGGGTTVHRHHLRDIAPVPAHLTVHSDFDLDLDLEPDGDPT